MRFNKDNPLRVVTLCSGYDSQCLGLDRLKEKYPDFEYDLIEWSEIDKYAIQAHNAIYPQWANRNLGDMTKIDWSQVSDFDLLFYSCPCQDFSRAGKHAGGDEGSGTRSSILWYTRNAIIMKKPMYALMENVRAVTSDRFIMLFRKWEQELASYGYANHCQVLNAKNHGVPQNRERTFLISVRDDESYFSFPEPLDLQRNIKDVLEESVEDRYYISGEKLEKYLVKE